MRCRYSILNPILAVATVLGCSSESNGPRSTPPPPFSAQGGAGTALSGESSNAAPASAAPTGSDSSQASGSGLGSAGNSTETGTANTPVQMAPAPAMAPDGEDPTGEEATDTPAPMGGVFGLGGPSRCESAALSICESFEAAPLGATPPAGWSVGGYGNRTLAVVDDERARGARSFRIDIAGDQGAVVGMLIRDDLGALGARHFGRSFMKIEAPAPGGFVHFDAFEARGEFEGQVNMVRWASTGTNVGTTRDNWSWIYNVQSTDHGEFGTEGARSAHPREGEWMCLEWFIEESAGEARFWYDGAEVDDLHIDSERSEIPIFDTFHVGFQKFQQTAAWRVWVDEVAFHQERIGCDG